MARVLGCAVTCGMENERRDDLRQTVYANTFGRLLKLAVEHLIGNVCFLRNNGLRKSLFPEQRNWFCHLYGYHQTMKHTWKCTVLGFTSL